MCESLSSFNRVKLFLFDCYFPLPSSSSSLSFCGNTMFQLLSLRNLWTAQVQFACDKIFFREVSREIHYQTKRKAMDFSATYKVLVLGDSNVGKTCIVHRFCDERYYDTYISTIGELSAVMMNSIRDFSMISSHFISSPSGIDFKQKLINLDGVPIKLQIWDVSTSWKLNFPN